MPLELTLDGLEAPEWALAGVDLPKFDVRQMVARTKRAAKWMHFAPSNLFTGEIAPRAQQLLDEGLMDTGIVGVETWDEEIVSRVLQPHDNLRVRVVMPPQAKHQTIGVIASLADSLAAATEWEGVKAYFAQPSLQMVTVTCTEKGYGIENPAVEADIAEGPANPRHIMSTAAAGAWHRFQNGAHPLAFVSMDNCSENGKLFQEAVMAIVGEWASTGECETFAHGFSPPSLYCARSLCWLGPAGRQGERRICRVYERYEQNHLSVDYDRPNHAQTRPRHSGACIYTAFTVVSGHPYCPR